jgi:hypothetical protein
LCLAIGVGNIRKGVVGLCVGVQLGNGACDRYWAVKGNAPEVLVYDMGWTVRFLETRSDLDGRTIVDLNVCEGEF